jgi:glycosyltransferase involved in cell wall biosynthesis
LKLIEAGHFRKAVIVSNVEPYTNIIRHKKNCLAVDKFSDWFTYAKLLLENRNLSADLGEQLHEDTQRFSIENVNKQRFKLLEQCTTKQLALQPEAIL